MRLTYSFAQTYLEVARSAVDSLEPEKLGALRRSRGLNRVANLLFASASLTIIYSYLAVESFVNYHLYQRWIDPQGTAKVELQRRFPKVQRFDDLRTTKLRDLRERLKTLCKLLRCRPIHEADPKLWADFTGLFEDSRHFLTHPIPDPVSFQSNMNRVMKKIEGGRYVSVAARVIDHLYRETGASPPEWLKANQTLRLKGLALIRRPRK